MTDAIGYRIKAIWEWVFCDRTRDDHEMTDSTVFHWSRDSFAMAAKFGAPAMPYDKRGSSVRGGVGLRIDQDTCLYPVDSADYITSALWAPEKLTALGGFELDATIPDDASVLMQFWNGSDWYVWAGTPGAWIVADSVTPALWCEEADLQAGFLAGGLDIGEREFQLRLKLISDDGTATPVVHRVNILGDFDYDIEEDLIKRSIKPTMEANIIVPADFGFYAGAADLSEVSLDTVDNGGIGTHWPLDLQGVLCAYNLTDDPNQEADIFSSWDAVTKTVTFSSSPAFSGGEPGDRGLIRVLFGVKFIQVTGIDLAGLEAVPEVLMEDLAIVDTRRFLGQPAVIRHDKANLAAVKVYPPQFNDYRLTLTIKGPATEYVYRIANAIKAFLDQNRMLTLAATGHQVSWRVTSDLSLQVIDSANQDLRAGSMEIGIFNVPRWGLGYGARRYIDTINILTKKCCSS